jgi:hypothetical protein
MASPAICIRDASIANNSFQITDLWPNRAQANPVVDPVAQGPRYLRQPENQLPTVDQNGLTTNSTSGLTSYILITAQDGNPAAPTPAQAKLIADAVISEMRAGGALTALRLGVIYGNAVAGFSLGTGSVEDILSILAGAKFTLEVGVDTTLLANATATRFDSTVFKAVNENDSSFWISVARGQLSTAISEELVVCYDGAGNVLPL